VRFLVVHAHPDPVSFSASVRDAAVEGLRAAGHDVHLIDLYADQFDPRLSFEERTEYEGPNPIRHPLVQKYADLVKSCEGLVFVYPTWWWGAPAILKGFLDRVLVPGVSFTLDPKTNKVIPGLAHVRRVVGVSTYGSSWVSTKIFNDAGRRMVMRCVRALAPAIRCRTNWLALYRLDHSSPQRREAFVLEVRKAMGDL
jgi:NAD(P)H dehydrogenase (quinone)